MKVVVEAFAKAAPARALGAAGPKTKELVDNVHRLLKQYGVKPTSEYVADNLSRLQFKGTFGKKVKAKDPKQFGGLGGKPLVLDITVSPGRQVWVNVTAWKGRSSLSLALPKRDLGTTFTVIQRAVRQVLDDITLNAKDAPAGGKDTSMDPQKYHKEHGRCPSGYQYDGKRCVEV